MYRFLMNPSRKGLRLIVFLLSTFAVASMVLLFVLRSATFKNWLETEISQQTGLEIRVTSLDFQLPFGIVAETVTVSKPGEFLFTAARLIATVTPFGALSKTVRRLDIENPVLQVDLTAVAAPSSKTAAEIALSQLNVREGTLVLTKEQTTVFELPKINLTANNLNLSEQSGIHMRADVPSLNGEAELRMSGAPRNLETEIIVRPKQKGRSFASREPNPAGGELVRLRARLHARENQKAEVTLESNMDDLTLGEASITGHLDARMEIDPDWKTGSLSGRATLVDFPKAIYPPIAKFLDGQATASFAGAFEFESKTLSLRSLKFTSPLGAGAGKAELIFESPARVARADLTLREIPLDHFKFLLPAPFNQWVYRGSAEAELHLYGAFDSLGANGIVRANPIELRSAFMNVTNLVAAAPFEWSKTALRIQDATLNLAKPTYGTKNRWQASAERVQARASLEFKAGEPLTIHGEIVAAGGKFSSPDASKVGENLNFSAPLEITITARPPVGSTRLIGKFRADSGEILWGKFFADLKTVAPAIELNADYLGGGDRFDCHACQITLARVGTVEVAGSVEHLSQSPELHLQARSTNFSPEGFFEFALRDTFKRQYPALDKVSIDGQMSFQMNLSGPVEAMAIKGELSVKSGALRAKASNWQVGPIALNLPFQIDLPASGGNPAGIPQNGTLSIEKAFFGGQSIGPVMTTVSLWNNALRFHQPIRANVFGGEVEIANLFWPDVISDPKRLSFSAAARQLQLAQVTEALNWHPFAGTLTGSIPEVQSAENLLRTSGEIQAEVFGGRASIGKLEIENPFSSLASIKLDAKLSGIQLEQLSRTFEFGGISGILEGSIDELVITDNQPSQFRADVHSVDRGAEQRISVEALNKITVLSSGENAGALYSGLASFFDSFRYSKLGFKASLKNDRLTLRGVESRGDQEFLVVGSFLPPTVNIISHTQNIAFSELMRRLERIQTNQPEIQ